MTAARGKKVRLPISSRDKAPAANPRKIIVADPDEITVAELRKLLSGGDKPLLLDVRERDEFAARRIGGSVNVPAGTVFAGVLDRQLPKNRLVVTICEHGNRSFYAKRELSARGFVCRSLRGGVEAWADSGGPTVSSR